eukprot:XP_028337789.1 uncharacterized protein LOC114484628 isoform X1 [Physeter catodon]
MRNAMGNGNHAAEGKPRPRSSKPCLVPAPDTDFFQGQVNPDRSSVAFQKLRERNQELGGNSFLPGPQSSLPSWLEHFLSGGRRLEEPRAPDPVGVTAPPAARMDTSWSRAPVQHLGSQGGEPDPERGGDCPSTDAPTRLFSGEPRVRLWSLKVWGCEDQARLTDGGTSRREGQLTMAARPLVAAEIQARDAVLCPHVLSCAAG